MFPILFIAAGAGATDIPNQILITKEKLITHEKFERQALAEIYSVSENIKRMSRHRGRLSDRALAAEAQVRRTAAEIALLEIRSKAQRRALSGRLRAQYKMGGKDVARLIFSAQSSVELDRNLKFLKILAERDYDLIRDYEKSVASLRKQRVRLNREVRNLLESQKKLNEQEDIMQAEQKTKLDLVAKLKESQRQAITEIKLLRAKQDTWGIIDTAFFERRGQLPSPVGASLHRPYGIYHDENFRFQLNHKGLSFAAEPGAEVRGISDGKVAFAGHISGHGQVVIIDHGDHYYSVYCYLQQIEVAEGAQVVESQLIGRSGQGLPSLGGGLYFELRHFSEAIDPRPWLKDLEEIKTSGL